MVITALLALFCLSGGTERPSDQLVLNNGRAHTGRLLFEDKARVVFKVKSRTMTFEREDVATLEIASSQLETMLTRVERVTANPDAAAWMSVAAELDAAGLPLEAELAYWGALAADSMHAPAHENLAHLKRGDKWLIKDSGRFYALDKLEMKRSGWGDAWEFSTTHFDIRTNVWLHEAIKIAFDLERIYAGFYGLFGESLELYQITDPMPVAIHADSKSYPELSGATRKGYFSVLDEALVINASSGLDVDTFVHEATHELLFYVARKTRKARGSVPAWLDEGLAMYMSACRVGELGGLGFEKGLQRRSFFAAHAGAKKAYGLTRVLNFSSGDYLASSNSELKYSQSYTLVDFLLQGDSQRHAEGLMEFIRGALLGKSSSTHFKKAIDVKPKLLEANWGRYVLDVMDKR